MKTTASFLRLLLFFIGALIIIEWVYPGDEWAMLTQPILWAIVSGLMLFAVAFEICIAALENVLFRTLTPKQQESYKSKRALKEENRFKWFRDTYKKALGSKAIEEEHDIILDHNYDGIKELDNDLPPWWVWGFYGTILFAVVYLVRFEVLNDYNQDEEYEIAVAEAAVEIAEWKKTAKDLVDVNTVVLLTEASDLKAGQTIFNANCIACHKADGGGGIGPNLTDRNWILGGGIKNVFNTISEGGRDGKGMISWKSELKPSEMAQVASYVLSFGGTTPAEPKEAEGDIWVDPEASEDTKIDTETKEIKTKEIKTNEAIKIVKDSTAVNVTLSN